MACVKVCKVCNNEFVANSNRQLICDDCKAKAKVIKPIKCKWCGEEFVPKHKATKYCSVDCKVLAKLKYAKGYAKMYTRAKLHRAGTLDLPKLDCSDDFKLEAKRVKALKNFTFKGKKNTESTNLDYGAFNGDNGDYIDYDASTVMEDVDAFFIDNVSVNVSSTDKVSMKEYAKWFKSEV
jgi:hypothetical protein